MIEYLGQAITSLSAATSIAKTIIGLRDENLLNAKLIELQQCIIDAQQKILSGQTEQSAAVKKMESLEAEIARLKDWTSERQNYDLKQIGHSVFVYIPRDFTGRYHDAQKFCVNCFAKGIKSLLQNVVRPTGRNVHLICQNGCAELTFHHFTDPPTA